MATELVVHRSPMQDTQLLEDLRFRFNAGVTLQYLFFWGHRPGKTGITASCLSQWYDAPFVVDGQRYPTAEHFMMAEKAALFGDHDIRTRILAAPSPKDAKALGREIRDFNETTWVENRFAIVVRANTAKFAQNLELSRFLHRTQSCVLVEASPVDRIWGIGLTAESQQARNPNLWRGLNLLGFALMHVRDSADQLTS